MCGMLGGPEGLPDGFSFDAQKLILPFPSYPMAALLVKVGPTGLFCTFVGK